jgi:hypothetical protein
MLFEQAGLTDQAQECWWEARLWWTGTARLDTLRKGEQYFRPIGVLPASDDDQVADVGSEPSRVLGAGSPHAISDEAKAYFDRQLNRPRPPLIQARYADFLFDQKYTAGMRRRIDYATLAVNAYSDVARSALPEADLTIDAAIFLLRAAFIAVSVQHDTLIEAVRIAVVDGLRQLRDEGRFRFTIELTRALLMLGSKVPRQDLELAADILQKGARIEHETGRYYAERPFLGALVDTRKALKDTIGAREPDD